MSPLREVILLLTPNFNVGIMNQKRTFPNVVQPVWGFSDWLNNQYLFFHIYLK